MSLYKDWNDMVVDFVQTKGEKAFWDVYSDIEKRIYEDILSNGSEKFTYTMKGLAEKVDTTVEFAMGFTDGINDSLRNPLNLEELGAEDEVELDIDFEKLYFNMLDAKAEYLYTIGSWENLLSAEKREEIKKTWKNSRTVKNEVKIGRNDPCPCGSGKKYKKCCGKAS
ncbi:SEC-C metal-binding domain-containing protein [Youngiibacter fragilis]|uniref:Preprotein translocase SecA n=1 Tax=Youngiibacter fragilis 232.1 TaxID=994573 RepID=V7I4X0_9CLOT|nr:SEC-C metal-binding domain-containing protein [Youngiibacter fragilis]ETA81285.1 hypothetical protein T472_0207170 [Youngiibacter fragilis 232.1]